jgi:hypothetical protein
MKSYIATPYASSLALSNFVTPAKAGVHHLPTKFRQLVMDSRLRGNDDISLLNCSSNLTIRPLRHSKEKCKRGGRGRGGSKAQTSLSLGSVTYILAVATMRRV